MGRGRERGWGRGRERGWRGVGKGDEGVGRKMV